MSQNKSLHNDVCTYFILNGISIENERHRGGFMFFFVAEKFCNNTPTSILFLVFWCKQLCYLLASFSKVLIFFVAILSQHFVCLNNIRRMISLHYFWEGIVCSIFVCGRNQRVLYKLAMKTFLHWKQKVLISLAVLQTEIRQSTQWTNCAVISRSHYFWIQVIFNPLAPRIWLSILPCTCFNFQVN